MVSSKEVEIEEEIKFGGRCPNCHRKINAWVKKCVCGMEFNFHER